MSGLTIVAVAHLLWPGVEPTSLQRFLESLRANPPGVSCEMVMIFKGFEPGSTAEAERLKLLKGWTYRRIDLEDKRMDLGDYRLVADRVSHKRVCFLNSHAEILCPDWLKHLTRALDKEDKAGMVGATGSFEMSGPETPFPNVHLRTNGFLIDRQLFLELDAPDLSTKRGCGLFEAGPKSLTRQIVAKGLIPYVVDKTGKAFKPEDWRTSKTFRAEGQENLMIADNRTRHWHEADAVERRYLETLAWSGRDPGPNPAKRGKASYWLKSISRRIKGNRPRFRS